MRRLALTALLLAMGMALPGRAAVAQAPVRETDAQIEALAKSAMASSDPHVQADALARLRAHHFKSSLAQERELTLFIQGMLEDRLGQPAQAAVTFHKLERDWPRSPYLPEAQVVLAQAAVERRRFQEAESRLRRALGADIPVDSQRRGQELLLWTLAEQGRAAEGAEVLKAMKPLGGEQPSERGLVGILEAQCAARRKPEAEAARQDYHRLFPAGAYAQRVDLDWARLLGGTGDAPGAAAGFRGVIQAAPASPEADEARLALATLLTDGRLPAKEAGNYPSARSLLAGMKPANMKDAPARQALMVKARIALQERRWQETLTLVGQYRALHPPPAGTLEADQLRAEALRQWTRELLDQRRPGPLLPYLDPEGGASLTPALRLELAGRLAGAGLPEAAQAILPLAPPGERPALLKAALDGTTSGANPEGVLALLPGKGEGPRESLARAQAELALRQWPQARAALVRASAGPERIQALVAYLDRPLAEGETPQARRRDVEAWLARAPEKGADREPLAILAADLRVRGEDWRGALALYPGDPRPEDKGWVTLMRATCQDRLGQKDAALATLKQAGDEKAFKAERDALQQRLGM